MITLDTDGLLLGDAVLAMLAKCAVNQPCVQQFTSTLSSSILQGGNIHAETISPPFLLDSSDHSTDSHSHSFHNQFSSSDFSPSAVVSLRLAVLIP